MQIPRGLWVASLAVALAGCKRDEIDFGGEEVLVRFESEPPGASVEVDDKPLCPQTPCTKALTAGRHKVVVRRECDGATADERIKVSASDKLFRFQLEPRWAGLKVSAEDMSGNAVEASILVDGKVVGTTPANVKVLACSKEVVVRGPDGMEFQWALALKPGEVTTVNGGLCPKGMAYIPGGSFNMGDEDYGPIHKVTLSPFCIDRMEHAESDGMPTVNVDWNRAKQICESEGKRLPTEAEWEFAARGTQGRKYPWGETEPKCGWVNFGDCGRQAKWVGSFPAGATPEGVQDLAGNVWEWVADCYGDYPSAPQINPLIDYASCERRVFRGGGFDIFAALVRSSFRNSYYPRFTRVDLGFRCARGTGL